MSTLPMLSGSVVFEVKPDRYDELIEKETRLEMLEDAIRRDVYISDIKRVFGLEGDTD